MSTSAPTASKDQAADKFSVEKVVHDGITLLTMHGTLNETFEGRKTADLIRSKKVVVDMRDVRRFASWGMSEWMDFLRMNEARDLYLVECSTYAVSQVNLVTGLLGQAKLVSFYASYHCGSCSEELESLFIIPRDRDAIRELPGSSQDCVTCGGRARLEDYPASFFDAIAERPQIDIDDEVLALLRSRYKYDLEPDQIRFRAFRARQKDYTYIRLSGSLALLPGETLAVASEGTTVLDLQGLAFDPAHASQWRTYVPPALAKVKSLQLMNCPPGFVETAVSVDDLRGKLKVRSFALAYDCLRCETSTFHLVDVAANLEQLVGGVAPEARCQTCKSLLVSVLRHDQLEIFRALPARDRDPVLDKFLAKASAEPVDNLENCLTLRPEVPKTSAPGRSMYVAVALAAVVIAGLGLVVTWQLLKKDAPPPVVVVDNPVVAPPPKPAFTRPDWIMSDGPLSAYCHDLINRLMCVGVSSYAPTRDEAVVQANTAALEELVTAIGLKISDPYFRDNVLPTYSAARSKAISTMQASDVERTGAPYIAAAGVIAKNQKRVVEILQASGGAAVPSQRSDWYWEEYVADKGKGNEVLVFVRYDITLDAVRALVEKYSTTAQVLGGSAMTAFPGLAWQHEDFTGGVILTKVGKPLARAGIAAPAIVMAVGANRVSDVGSLVRRLEEAAPQGEDVELSVKAGDAPARVVSVKRR